MKWNFKVNVTTLLVTVLAVVVFFWFRHQKNTEIETAYNNLLAVNQQHTEYVSMVDSVKVVQQRSIRLLEQQIRELAESDSIQREMVAHYKNLAAVVKIETKFVHDTVRINVPIYVDRDTSVQIWHDCFDVDLSLSNGSLSFDYINIENRQDIVLGERKPLLSKSYQDVSVRNSNPCITTTGVTSYTIISEKKWWENPIITTLAGFTTGFVVSSFVNK